MKMVIKKNIDVFKNTLKMLKTLHYESTLDTTGEQVKIGGVLADTYGGITFEKEFFDEYETGECYGVILNDLFNIISKYKEVTIQTDGGCLKITSGKDEYKIPIIDDVEKNDIGKLTELKHDIMIKTTFDELNDILSKLKFTKGSCFKIGAKDNQIFFEIKELSKTAKINFKSMDIEKETNVFLSFDSLTPFNIKSSDELEIHMGTDIPVKIIYTQPNMEFIFYRAQRIDYDG